MDPEPVPHPIRPEAFDLLEKYREAQPNFRSLTEVERAEVKALRQTLLEYAQWMKVDFGTRTELEAFASHPSPSGRVSRHYWSCVFPAAVENKSWAFQLFVIVNADGVEVGFGSGSGASPFRTTPLPASFTAAMDQARRSLAELRGSPLVEDVGKWALEHGFGFREGWAREPREPGFASIQDWIDHASTSGGGGSAISTFLDQKEVVALGAGFYRRCLDLLRPFSPLLDAIYSGIAPSSFEDEWAAVLAFVQGGGLWQSLDQERRYAIVSVANDVVAYTGEDGPRRREFTKARAASYWTDCVRSGVAGIGARTSSLTAFLALFPSIEYELNPLRLFYAGGPSHAVGVPTRFGGEAPREPVVIETAQSAAALDMDWLRAVTLLPDDRLQELVQAIGEGHPQVVFAGPPGTSKTWIAKAIAAHVTGGDPRRVRTVQLHPSYTYEQFIEGLMPRINDAGMLEFGRTDGKVLDVIGKMRDRDELTILIVDEMNRANLPKVFGELLYLFEYREEAIDLQYSQEFKLPRGLHFVGTMNTADRSIRSIDVALRRRFEVFDFPPDVSVLERYYTTHVNEVPDLISGFTSLNEALTAELDRHHTVGHTFLMADPMTSSQLARIWDRKIAPLIEEYFFDQSDISETFTLSRFWPSLA